MFRHFLSVHSLDCVVLIAGELFFMICVIYVYFPTSKLTILTYGSPQAISLNFFLRETFHKLLPDIKELYFVSVLFMYRRSSVQPTRPCSRLYRPLQTVPAFALTFAQNLLKQMLEPFERAFQQCWNVLKDVVTTLKQIWLRSNFASYIAPTFILFSTMLDHVEAVWSLRSTYVEHTHTHIPLWK